MGKKKTKHIKQTKEPVYTLEFTRKRKGVMRDILLMQGMADSPDDVSNIDTIFRVMGRYMKNGSGGFMKAQAGYDVLLDNFDYDELIALTEEFQEAIEAELGASDDPKEKATS